MKNTHLLGIIMLALALPVHAQNLKEIYGNFIIEGKVFQYRFEEHNHLYQLELSRVSNEPTRFEFPPKHKIDSTISAYKTYRATLKTADTLNIDSMIALMRTLDTLGLSFSRVSTLSETALRYSFMDTISVLKNLPTAHFISMKELAELSAMPERKQKTSFHIFSADVFKKVFVMCLTATDEAMKSATVQKQVDDVTNELFYTIKARLDFLDDEPVTANIQLVNNTVSVRYDVTFVEANRQRYNQLGWWKKRKMRRTTKKSFKAEKEKLDKEIKEDEKSKKDVTEKKKILILLTEKIKNSRTKKRYKKYILVQDRLVADSILMKIEKVDIEFEEGAIKNIFVDMKPLSMEYSPAPLIRFRNNIPITVSGKFDPFKFANHTIFIGNHEPLGELLRNHYKALNQGKDATVIVNTFNVKVSLAKLIDYKVTVISGNEDYSPADGVIRLDGLQSVAELKKEKRSKIISARAFTDVVGLDSDQPNGLVQIEVSKKVNFSTIRFQNKQTRFLKNSHTGLLTSLEPRLVISKIEDNNRYIPVNVSDLKDRSDTINRDFNLLKMDVLRYQNWSFGMDINLFKLYMPDLKSNLQVNGFYHYGRSLAQDSLSYTGDSIKRWTATPATHITRINTHNYGIGVMFEIRPDSRYGFSFGYDWRWLALQTEGITYRNNANDGFRTAWFNAFINTGTDTKLFFRFRKHWASGDPNQTFYQVQTGVAFDVFKTK